MSGPERCSKCNKEMRLVSQWFKCARCKAWFCPSCMTRFCLFCKGSVEESAAAA